MANINTKEDLNNLIIETQQLNATDLYLNVGTRPVYRLNGEVNSAKDFVIDQEDIFNVLKIILTKEKADELKANRHCSLPYSVPRTTRTRVIVFMQRGSYAISFRIGQFDSPTKEELRLPTEFEHIFDIKSGLVIISGLNSSGRSSTCSYIIDTLRKTQKYYINTVEDPIEHLFRHDLSLVNQIEVGVDVNDYLSGIKVAFEGYADVVYISELCSREAMEIMLNNVRKGKLIIAVMDVSGSVNVIRNIINFFPVERANYIMTLLSQTLSAVVSQQLIEDASGRMIPVCDILYGTKSVKSMINENKLDQIEQLLSNPGRTHMLSHDNHLLRLYNDGMITEEALKKNSINWKDISHKAVK